MIWWTYFTTQLSILQLENYEVHRWLKWWVEHPLVVLKHTRKPLVWTKRLYVTVGCGLPFFLFPPLMVLVGGCVVSQIDLIHRSFLKKRIQTLLRQNSGCKKIAITGSFGKTSVKEFLYTILDQTSYALTTPGSFNTFGGIFRVLDRELMPSHHYFVAELGAYHPGDISEMVNVIRPDFGILTAVGPQHMERFGSQETITQTKFELFGEVPQGKLLVNWDNGLIRAYVQKNGLIHKVVKMSVNDVNAEYVVTRAITSNGIKLGVNGKHMFDVPHLFGSVMAENVSLAIAAAMELGIRPQSIQNGLAEIRPPFHRLELSRKGDATLIDDTYSSNASGFTQVVEDLRPLSGLRAVVTPGVVELGESEHDAHLALGKQMATVFDTVILVGVTSRTKSLKLGLKLGGFKGLVKTIPAETPSYWQTVNELSQNHSWILLENDVSEQYL